MVTMLFLLAMLGSATPGITAYLDMCDPVQCAPLMLNVTQEESNARVVDCLAAGTWEGYQKRFDGHSYPASCPKIMLKCKGDQEDISGLQERDDQTAQMLKLQEQLQMAKEQLRLQGVGLLPAPSEQLRRLSISTQAFYPPVSGSVARSGKEWWNLPRWDEAHTVGEQPIDPIADCKPKEKGMRMIHQARLLLPQMVPKLVVFIFVKMCLLIPVILLGCIGFWWGKELYDRLGQGYGRLGFAETGVQNIEFSAQSAATHYADPSQEASLINPSAPIIESSAQE